MIYMVLSLIFVLTNVILLDIRRAMSGPSSIFL